MAARSGWTSGASRGKSLNKNLGALEDRGVLLLFQPDAAAVHARAKCADAEVYDFIGQPLHLIAEPSMRQYEFAVTVTATPRS